MAKTTYDAETARQGVTAALLAETKAIEDEFSDDLEEFSGLLGAWKYDDKPALIFMEDGIEMIDDLPEFTVPAGENEDCGCCRAMNRRQRRALIAGRFALACYHMDAHRARVEARGCATDRRRS